jgi:hypothetical protein
VRFHSVGETFCEVVISLIPLLGLVYLGILVVLLVLVPRVVGLRPRKGRAGGCDYIGTNDRALLHRHSLPPKMGFQRLIDAVFCEEVDLLAVNVLL